MDNPDTVQAVVSQLEKWSDRECLVALESEGISRWSCAEVAGQAQRLARGLIGAGVQRGEFVPLLAPNRPEWVIAALAIISSGAAVSPLDTQITTETLERVLHDSGARFIFTTTEYLNRLRQFDLAVELRPILLDVEPGDERGWCALLADTDTPLPTVEPDEPAALFYTSGTTGIPKGVPLTHRNLAFQLEAVRESRLLRPDDRVMLPLPMYHVYPFTVGTLTPLAFGLPLVLPQSLTGPQVIRALREGNVTIIIGVPRVYRAMYSGIEGQISARGKLAAAGFRAALRASIWLQQRIGWRAGKSLFKPLRAQIGPNLRLLASGGSALDPDLAWKLEGFGWDVAIGYGLTETSPMLTMNIPDSGIPKLASVGRPLRGVDIRIDTTARPAGDDNGESSGNGATSGEGEILARGTSVFSGYRQRPEETAKAFTGDGWFRTGDLGYFDQEGYLYISGRASTLIVLEGGKKIQPEALEDVYQQNEFIREIGILYQNNQLVALIVPEVEAVKRQRNGDAEQAIREAVSERSQVVASYQRLSDYAITAEPLPRTNLGKVRRHLLVEQYNRTKQGLTQQTPERMGPVPIEDMSEKDQALLDHPAARQVWDWLAAQYPDKRLAPETSPQLDLGIDSMDWLTLTLQVRDLTGVELNDESIRRINIIRDLLQEVATAEESDTMATSLEEPQALLTEEQTKWLTPMNPALEAISAVLFLLLQRLARLYFRVKVYGAEKLPLDQSFILTPNHTSMLDAPMVATALPYRHLRQTYWAGATDVMFTNPLIRLISRLGRVLPIERFGGGTGIKNLALAITTLEQGKNLVWFPEGRISKSENMLPFKEGIGLLLDRQPGLVVPVLIEGARDALPPDTGLPKPKPVTITFGQPVDSRELAQQGGGELAATRIARALQERLSALGEQSHHLQRWEEGPSSPARVLTSPLTLGLIVTFVIGVVWFFRRRSKGK